MYTQFGCGLCAPDSWRNFDASPTLRLQKIPVIGSYFANAGIGPEWPSNVEYGDIVKGLPVSRNSCHGIYSSHVLEHLPLEDFRSALANIHLYLDKGKKFRFVMPDLERMAKNYVDDNNPNAAIKFIRSTRMGIEHKSKDIRSILSTIYGNREHRWMWDFKALKKELDDFGFINIRRAYYGDSEDPAFKAVENKNRWRNELGIECVK